MVPGRPAPIWKEVGPSPPRRTQSRTLPSRGTSGARPRLSHDGLGRVLGLPRDDGRKKSAAVLETGRARNRESGETWEGETWANDPKTMPGVLDLAPQESRRRPGVPRWVRRPGGAPEPLGAASTRWVRQAGHRWSRGAGGLRALPLLVGSARIPSIVSASASSPSSGESLVPASREAERGLVPR